MPITYDTKLNKGKSSIYWRKHYRLFCDKPLEETLYMDKVYNIIIKNNFETIAIEKKN